MHENRLLVTLCPITRTKLRTPSTFDSRRGQEAGEEPRMAGPIAGTTHRCRWSQARRMLRQAVPPPPCSCMFVLQMVTAQIKICVSDPRISFVPRPYRQSTGMHATKLARGLLVYSHSMARQDKQGQAVIPATGTVFV